MTSILDRLSRHGEDPAPGAISAVHSGNIGDVVYALPTVRALGVSHLLLNVCEDPGAGGRVLTEAMAQSLVSLLLDQPTINTVDIVAAPIRVGGGFGYQARVSNLVSGLPLEHISASFLGVDYVLDRFRLEPLERRHLVEAHAMAFGCRVDSARAWIECPKVTTREKRIAVSVTPRYRNRPNERLAEILEGFGPVTLIGFRSELPNYFGIEGELREFTDAKELVGFLAECSVFVGAASFPCAIAEAMKIPRLIDLADGLINAFPVGPNGWAMPESSQDARHLLDGMARGDRSAAGRVKPFVKSATPTVASSRRFTLEWRQAEGELIGTHRASAEAVLGRAPARVRVDVPRTVDRPAGFALTVDARVGALEVSNLRCVEGATTIWTARQPEDLSVSNEAVLSSPPGVLRWLMAENGADRVNLKVPDEILARFRETQVSIVFDCRAPRQREITQWTARAIASLSGALSRERANAERIQAELSLAHQKQADLEHRLRSVQASTSWRVTAPLRAVTGMFKPGRGGDGHGE
jgi:hypothetical protein